MRRRPMWCTQMGRERAERGVPRCIVRFSNATKNRCRRFPLRIGQAGRRPSGTEWQSSATGPEAGPGVPLVGLGDCRRRARCRPVGRLMRRGCDTDWRDLCSASPGSLTRPPRNADRLDSAYKTIYAEEASSAAPDGGVRNSSEISPAARRISQLGIVAMILHASTLGLPNSCGGTFSPLTAIRLHS